MAFVSAIRRDQADPGSQETILVVEDDPDVRAYVAETLSTLNYRVRQAADAEAAITILNRLGEVRASLARKPTEFETAIELPARLTLSTAQDAIWLADRKLLSAVLNTSSCEKLDPAKAPVSKPEVGEAVLKPGRSERSRKPLWTARLSLDGAQPDLRIVDSPDLRPLALTLLPYKDRLPGQGAPPRGPLAPWFIGPEQMDAKTLTADSVNKSLPDDKKRSDE
jgi:CheY-like chemotaxis protein